MCMVICGMAQNNFQIFDRLQHTGQCWWDLTSHNLQGSQLLGTHSGQNVDSDGAESEDAEADDQGDTSVHAHIHSVMDIDTFLSKYSYEARSNHCDPYKHTSRGGHGEF